MAALQEPCSACTFTDEFEEWWNGGEEAGQIKIDATIPIPDEFRRKRLATLSHAQASCPGSGEAVGASI
jgi:hypothetical protein